MSNLITAKMETSDQILDLRATFDPGFELAMFDVEVMMLKCDAS